jgi:hypothetical protein
MNFDETHKISIDGIPYTVHITKQSTKEWKLTVFEARNIPDVYNHTPEKCINSLKMQLESRGRRFEIIKV